MKCKIAVDWKEGGIGHSGLQSTDVGLRRDRNEKAHLPEKMGLRQVKAD
jgi:hypothetical protein